MNTELFQLFQALHGQLEPVEAKLLFKTNGLGIQATTVYDSEKDIIKFCRFPYDLKTTQQKILRKGFAPFLSERLSAGL